MQSDGWDLVNHDESCAVREPHKLFRIGIMRGAEGVGADPRQQIQVFHIGHFIKPTAMYGKVLVFPEALEIERLPIDEKAPVLHRDRAKTERLRVGISTLPIVPQLNRTRIQVGVKRLPEVHACDGELAGWPGACGDNRIGLVADKDADLRIALGLDGVVEESVRSGNIYRDRDITHIRAGSRVELDRALDARVVEEVKVWRIGR